MHPTSDASYQRKFSPEAKLEINTTNVGRFFVFIKIIGICNCKSPIGVKSVRAQNDTSGINTFKPIICCECAANTSSTCETFMCHDSLCCTQYEGSLAWRKQREEDRETDRERERERCSSEAQPHLLFMTHRKSFSMSSRWYPGSKHNTQPSEHKSAWPVTDSEMGRGQQGVVAGCGVSLMSSGCKGISFHACAFLFIYLLLPFPSLSLCLPAPPKFTKIPTDQIGVSGGVASFVCQAAGNPKPVVYWNKKGKKVNSQRIEVVVTVHNANSYFSIMSRLLYISR